MHIKGERGLRFTHEHAHTYTHMCIHTHMYTLTHIHTQTQALESSEKILPLDQKTYPSSLKHKSHRTVREIDHTQKPGSDGNLCRE